MSVSRKTKAIYPVIALFFFSGLAFIIGVMVVTAGLGGYKPKFGIFEIIFLLSILVALISYGFSLYNFIMQINRHKWSGLLIWEKLNTLVLLVMLSPIYTVLNTISVIDFSKLQ